MNNVIKHDEIFVDSLFPRFFYHLTIGCLLFLLAGFSAGSYGAEVSPKKNLTKSTHPSAGKPGGAPFDGKLRFPIKLKVSNLDKGITKISAGCDVSNEDNDQVRLSWSGGNRKTVSFKIPPGSSAYSPGGIMISFPLIELSINRLGLRKLYWKCQLTHVTWTWQDKPRRDHRSGLGFELRDKVKYPNVLTNQEITFNASTYKYKTQGTCLIQNGMISCN